MPGRIPFAYALLGFCLNLAFPSPTPAADLVVPPQSRAAPPTPAAGRGLAGRIYHSSRGLSSLERMREITVDQAPSAFLRLPDLAFFSNPPDPLGQALGDAEALPPLSPRLSQPAGIQWYLELDGFVNVPRPGEYSVKLLADDGFRLKIGGRTFLEADTDAWGRTFTGTVSFAEPGLYPIEVQHFQGIREARLEVSGELFGRGSLHDVLPGSRAPTAETRMPDAVTAQGPLGAQVVLDAAPSRARPDARFTWFSGTRKVAEGRRATGLFLPGKHSLLLEVVDAGGRSIVSRELQVRPLPAAAGVSESPASGLRPFPLPPAPGTGLHGRFWDAAPPLEDYTDVHRIRGTELPSAVFTLPRIDCPPGEPTTCAADRSLEFWLGGSAGLERVERLGQPLGDYRILELTGCIRIDEPGEVTFDVNSDDGFQLWIGGRLLSEAPRPRPPVWTTARIRFPEKGLYPIRLSYYQMTGGAGLTLTSSLPGNGAALGPEGRTVVDPRQLYPEPPGGRVQKAAFVPIKGGPAQGPLGTQVLLDATPSERAGGRPLEVTWWVAGKRTGANPRHWSLIPPGRHRVRLEVWDGGLPATTEAYVHITPGIREVSFAPAAGHAPPVYARGKSVRLSLRLAGQDGEAFRTAVIRAEVTVRRLDPAGGSDLVGPRSRPMVFDAAAGQWVHVLRTESLPVGRYQVEARILDAERNLLEQIRGNIILR